MYISGTGEWRTDLTPEEQEQLILHEEIASRLDNLDQQSTKIFIGFIVFWAILGLSFIAWFWFYLIPTVQGWF